MLDVVKLSIFLLNFLHETPGGTSGTYLEHDLLKSQFVNLKIRLLIAETGHEFIEWCGLLGSTSINDKLKPNSRI